MCPVGTRRAARQPDMTRSCDTLPLVLSRASGYPLGKYSLRIRVSYETHTRCLSPTPDPVEGEAEGGSLPNRAAIVGAVSADGARTSREFREPEGWWGGAERRLARILQ